MKLDLDDSIGQLLGRTTRAMAAAMQSSFAKAGYDVTVEQWVILVNLWRLNGQFQKQLAENTYKDKASVTRLVNGLEKRNLVVRIPDEADQRHNRIYLTNKGKALQNELISLAKKTNTITSRGIEEQHLQIFKAVLIQLHANTTEE
ncbi:MAG: MarR family transcriptional regulator [Proteobacteria bacterium]|nr:MarR family transcriptional regulator [Pseudomonadota bacterium]